MNFNLLRYSCVILSVVVAILVLVLLESFFMFLVTGAETSNFLGNRFVLFELGARWLLPLVVQHSAYLPILYLVAFAVAALVEGQNYYKRNTIPPASLNMLSGSIAMGLIGMGLCCAFFLGTASLVLGNLPLSRHIFSFWELFLIATTLVAASVTSRISFGIGLRMARKQQSAATGGRS
ncbi:hypothetical protein HW561_16880 [Rhodobacteraceae bacterium B1Z28]|uniref:TRAP-type C4-dicarboxylate transport system permease small subunit n=1 Tax=Ruegeria haliotis TaxID=2747601 RepID=A0ABX2PTH4_9RHOB|nr:hypothetical protein [Ruegeria haliotis]NVO57473.1 hypothetical protein [Ruegeria haliotis]